jgi:hypothetical protein
VARWPSLEKADHVCKWNVPMASTEAWWKAIANATPPHLKNVTCNAVKQWIHTLTHITYRWELTYEEEKVHCRPVRPTQLTMARRCQSSACSHLAGAFVTGLINPSQLPAGATDLSPPYLAAERPSWARGCQLQNVLRQPKMETTFLVGEP